MKKIWMGFRVIVLIGAIAYLIPFNTDTVKADGCPSDPLGLGCGCNLIDTREVNYPDRTVTYCTYTCYSCSPSGEPMGIEREETLVLNN